MRLTRGIEGRIGVTTAEILKSALDKPLGNWSRADETRVGVILRRLGWQPSSRSITPPDKLWLVDCLEHSFRMQEVITQVLDDLDDEEAFEEDDEEVEANEEA